MPENIWGYAKRLRFVLAQTGERFSGLPRGAVTILDIGCGNGTQLAIPLAEAGFQVTGIDPDAASVERARSLCSRGKFVCCDLSGLAYQQFHVVVLSEVLEHLTDPDALLREAVGFVRPDGILIVTTPNGFGPFEIDSWIYRRFRLAPLFEGFFRAVRRLRRRPEPVAPVSSSENHDGHLQFFTRRRLRRMFASHSLRVLAEAPASFLCGPTISYFLTRSAKAIRWNSQITDSLPMSMASGWYFVLGPPRKRESGLS